MSSSSRYADFKLEDPDKTIVCELCGTTALKSESVRWWQDWYCSRECKNLQMQEMKPKEVKRDEH